MEQNILSGVKGYPHPEWNEKSEINDKVFWHPGYEDYKCKKCGIESFKAYGCKHEVCGREKCGKAIVPEKWGEITCL